MTIPPTVLPAVLPVASTAVAATSTPGAVHVGAAAACGGARPPVVWSATLTVPIHTCLARVPTVHLPTPVPVPVLALAAENCVHHHRHSCDSCGSARLAERVFFAPAPILAFTTLIVVGLWLLLPAGPNKVAVVALTVATVGGYMAVEMLCLHLAARSHLHHIARVELPAEVVRLTTMLTSPGTVAFDPRTQPQSQSLALPFATPPRHDTPPAPVTTVQDPRWTVYSGRWS
jgi:hypothetical protein